MTVAMFIGLGVGYLGAVAAAFLVGRRIVAAVLRGGPFEAAQRRTIVRMAAAGGLVALLPALLLGTVIGGTLGGAYADAVVLGIAVGMFAVAALIICLAVAIGACVGRFIARGQHAAI